VQPPTADLPTTVALLEYGTCSDANHVAPLFDHRDCLQPYLTHRWLTRSFEGEQPCLRASHYVGVLPFSCENQRHLLLIAPKGCEREPRLGLVRFLELVALGEGETPREDEIGWQGQLGPHPFLLFLASHYARMLRNLCKWDFRSYYRSEEGDLRGHIRGRLQLASYIRGAFRGKAHVLPCHWEEFTVDNWDNRILWGAARRLQRVAAALDAQAAASVSRLFKPLLSWFGAVADVPISTADFRKSRLGRTSRYYRNALTWAQLLLRGSDLPSAAGQVPPLVLSASDAFERFAEVVARSSLPEHGWRATFQESWPFLTGLQTQRHDPDIIVSSRLGIHAVGDAKYKEVLERGGCERLESGAEVVRVCVQSADWNQLYAYMRMTGASCGFFVVPFWKVDGPLCDLLEPFEFVVPPCDGNVRVAVLGLNLLRPLSDVRQAAGNRLRAWLAGIG
jgi:hypothetical protein